MQSDSVILPSLAVYRFDLYYSLSDIAVLSQMRNENLGFKLLIIKPQS